MLRRNGFPSSFIFNFLCTYVVIMGISTIHISANLTELSSFGSGVNFSVLSVDDATVVSNIHVTLREQNLTANNITLSSSNKTASDSNITQLVDISIERTLPEHITQTTSRLTITDLKTTVEFYTANSSVTHKTAEYGFSSQEIFSAGTTPFTPTKHQDALENSILEELYNVSYVNSSTAGIFPETDASNILSKEVQNMTSFDEFSDVYKTLPEPLNSVKKQLNIGSNTSVTSPTSAAVNLTTLEITLLNHTGRELNKKSFDYLKIENESSQPSYQVLGSQHRDQSYFIYSSQIENPQVAIEKLDSITERNDVEIHFGTLANENDSTGNVPLTLKINNWFYKLIIDEAISMEKISNSLKTIFTEKDRLNIIKKNETNTTTETLGSPKNHSEMNVMNENKQTITNQTEASETANEQNFSNEPSSNDAYIEKNNDDHNTTTSTQMTSSYESGINGNLNIFPQTIFKNENFIINNELNLNKFQNSENKSTPSFFQQTTASTTESSQDINYDSLEQGLNSTGTQNITLQATRTESTPLVRITTEGKIYWNLCFTKRPAYNSILKPTEDRTVNTLLMTKDSSNTKVFWNLCPDKKPVSTTEIQQPAPNTTYSSVFLDALPDYLTLTSSTTTTTTSSNVFGDDLTSITNEGTDTTSTEPTTEETTHLFNYGNQLRRLTAAPQSLQRPKALGASGVGRTVAHSTSMNYLLSVAAWIPALATFSLSTETPDELFPVYWNVPTFQCHKYGLDFSQVSGWGLRQNYQDEFRGQEIAILYDPGEFPALLPAPGDRRVPRNGGVPQEGSLSRHLRLFEGHLDKLIPNTNFSGLAIIDFEHWRPVWRQNWGSLSPYRDFSRLVEKKRHPFWFSTMVEIEATYRFELGARVFLLDTLRAGKRLRPRASWGYYGYPFCFNYTPHNNKATCSYEVQLDNDSMFWLFSENTAYYPSLYLKSNDMYPSKRRRFIKGRLDEAMRVSQNVPVYPYIWYKYHDTDQFLSKDDMVNLLRMPMDNGCKGVVIWGASRDVNSRAKCNALLTYLDEVIGPAVRELHREPFDEAEEDIRIDETNLEETQETSDLEEDVEEKKRNYNIRDFEV